MMVVYTKSGEYTNDAEGAYKSMRVLEEVGGSVTNMGWNSTKEKS
jgi:hypothetical protein